MVVLFQISSKPYSWCCSNSICTGKEKLDKVLYYFHVFQVAKPPSTEKPIKSLGFLSLIANGNFLQSNYIAPAGPVNPLSVMCASIPVLALSLWKEHWKSRRTLGTWHYSRDKIQILYISTVVNLLDYLCDFVHHQERKRTCYYTFQTNLENQPLKKCLFLSIAPTTLSILVLSSGNTCCLCCGPSGD